MLDIKEYDLSSPSNSLKAMFIQKVNPTRCEKYQKLQVEKDILLLSLKSEDFRDFYTKTPIVVISWKEKSMQKTKQLNTENNVATPYDDVHRTMLNDCPKLIIPVVNEMFQKKT